MNQQRIYRYAPAITTLRRSPTRRAAAPSYRWLWLSLAVVVVPSMAFGFALLAGYAYFNLTGRVAPGVRAGGIPLGGLTVERATQRLAERWQDSASLVMTDGTRKWSLPAPELGFDLDAAATAERAYAAGRGPSGWIQPAGLVKSAARRVEPAFTFNSRQARQALLAAAAQVDIPSQEARVTYVDGHWQAVPGQAGLALDIDATLQAWQGGGETYLRAGLFPLHVNPVNPAVLDASQQAAALEAMMGQPLKLRAYDPVTDETFDLSFPPEQVAEWVRVDPASEGQAAIRLAPSALDEALNRLSDTLGGGRYLGDLQGLDDLTARWQRGRPLTARVYHADTTYTVQAGENLVSIAFKTGIPFWMIREANPGINPDRLSAGQILTIPSLDENLPLPPVEHKRIVISISRQRLWTFENGQQRTESVISTGIARSPTMPGIFQVRSHEVNAYASIWNLWMPNFLGIYEATPGFMNGIHGLPMLSSGARLWGNVLGSPASYGCIIMTLDEAEDIYNWAEEGVVVEIQP